MFFSKSKSKEVSDTMTEPTEGIHTVLGTKLAGPHPEGMSSIRFGMGCFWGVERIFWQVDGVHVTSVGYAGGKHPNPTYNKVCMGITGHAEVVEVVYDPARVSLDDLLKLFWENHDPTQGNRQGNDRGSQYRSIILCDDEATAQAAAKSLDKYQMALTTNGFDTITTEIVVDSTYHLGEDYHQQYLDKNPGGYCNHGFCQVEY